jgi:hypothetical protein
MGLPPRFSSKSYLDIRISGRDPDRIEAADLVHLADALHDENRALLKRCVAQFRDRVERALASRGGTPRDLTRHKLDAPAEGFVLRLERPGDWSGALLSRELISPLMKRAGFRLRPLQDTSAGYPFEVAILVEEGPSGRQTVAVLRCPTPLSEAYRQAKDRLTWEALPCQDPGGHIQPLEDGELVLIGGDAFVLVDHSRYVLSEEGAEHPSWAWGLTDRFDPRGWRLIEASQGRGASVSQIRELAERLELRRLAVWGYNLPTAPRVEGLRDRLWQEGRGLATLALLRVFPEARVDHTPEEEGRLHWYNSSMSAPPFRADFTARWDIDLATKHFLFQIRLTGAGRNLVNSTYVRIIPAVDLLDEEAYAALKGRILGALEAFVQGMKDELTDPNIRPQEPEDLL